MVFGGVQGPAEGRPRAVVVNVDPARALAPVPDSGLLRLICVRDTIPAKGEWIRPSFKDCQLGPFEAVQLFLEAAQQFVTASSLKV